MKRFSNWTTFYKVLKNTFQVFITTSQKLIVAMVTFQRDINLIRIRPERYFNTNWLIFLIPMQWNHLQTKHLFTKLWKKRFKDWPIYRQTDCCRGNFQRVIDIIKLRLKTCFNTGWFISSIPMQWNYVQTKQPSIRFWKKRLKHVPLFWEIDRRLGNLSAWY